MKIKKTRKKFPYKQFDNFIIGSSQFKTLKKFREKKQFTRFMSIDSMDLTNNGVIEDYILDNTLNCQKILKNFNIINGSECKINSDVQIFLQLDKYINSLIIYNFILNIYNELRLDRELKRLKPEVSKNIMYNIRQIFSLECPSINHRLDKNFFRNYLFLNDDKLNSIINYIVNKARINNLFKSVFQKTIAGFEQVRDYLEWDLNQTTKVSQCTLSGFYFRNAQMSSFYKGCEMEYLKKTCENNRIPLFYSGYISNDSELMINNNFCELPLENRRNTRPHYLNLEINSTNKLLRVKGIWITSKNTIILSTDKDTIKKYPSINLMSNKNRVRDYSFKVVDNLPKALMEYEKKNEDNLLYLGLEIECNKTPRCPNKINQLLEEDILSGTGVVKNDASLGNRGIEINIVPMTLDYAKHTDYYFKFQDRVREYLSSYKDSKTGIHIHIPRKLFTNYQIAKLLYFINKTDNYNYICSVGGRDLNNSNNSYSRTEDRTFRQWFKYTKNTDRYSALNTSTFSTNNDSEDNPKTLEFRLFKGNLSATTIYRYMEFVHSLATCVLSSGINNKCDYLDYVLWLTENKSQYPILYQFSLNVILKNKPKDVEITKKKLKEINNFKKINSFQLRYKKRYRNIEFNIPELKLATPLRIRKVRAVNIRSNIPITNGVVIPTTTTNNESEV